MPAEAVIDLVADSVASEINTQAMPSLTLPAGVSSLTAQRADAEVTDLTSLVDPLLLVIADKSATSSPILARNRMRGFLFVIWVIFYARVPYQAAAGDIAANNAAIDPWKLLTGQVGDWLAKSNPLAQVVNGQFPQILGEVTIDPYPSLDDLVEYGVYYAAINLPVYLQRQM